ncbi:hypothetical protein ACHAQH_006062 [Verticillium albo-atrum]
MADVDSVVKGAPAPGKHASDNVGGTSGVNTNTGKHGDPLSHTPSSPSMIYLNLLVLEASLRAQYLELRARRRHHTFFFAILSLWIGGFGYALFFAPREDGVGVGGSVYWGVETIEKLCFMGGIMTAILVWATGIWDRGIRWPRRWFAISNRGLRGFNAKLVIIRRPLWAEIGSTVGFFLTYGLFSHTASSSYRYIDPSILRAVEKELRLTTDKHPALPILTEDEEKGGHEEDLAPGGDYVKLLLLAKPFTPTFRENWELYRTEYWEKENERRALILKKLKEHERRLAKETWEAKIGDELVRYCTAYESVTLLLAGDPSLTPGDAWKRLYGSKAKQRGRKEIEVNGASPAPEKLKGLERIAACGKWGGTKPSELFLRMYGAALESIDGDLEQAVVSPSLMGGCGTVPLTIMSTRSIPDIVRHMSNLIVRADKEVFLATNYWLNSVAVTFITNGIRELDRRAGARGVKVVVKIMYDRGAVKQVYTPHYDVAEKEFTDPQVALPRRSEIPNVDLQVLNYHKPMLGTFHSKFMVVDRRIGLVQSNNIQDNANLEMAVQVEGPIVDSLYDMALITWDMSLGQGMPMIESAAATVENNLPSWTEDWDQQFADGGKLRGFDAVIDPSKMSWKEQFGKPDDLKNGQMNGYAVDGVDGVDGVAKASPIGPNGVNGTPHGTHIGTVPEFDTDVTGSSTVSVNSTPTPNTSEQHVFDLPEHTHDSPHYDDSIPAEILRLQTSLRPSPTEDLYAPITRHLNHTNAATYTVPPHLHPAAFAPSEQPTPYTPHPRHAPVPMALVNRPPHGPPDSDSLSNPQNAAWLAALSHARSSIFIQSPTLNASPLIPAILAACERGVHVWAYICLGYNDAGELLPLQGGHNEAIAHRLHAQLSEEARPRLHYHWYVAKDHAAPVPHGLGVRACHIKLLIADERVGVVGSGNQDTQSWAHSQEGNVMIDSPEICRSWIDALRRNQNTGLFGRLQKDGIWRDNDGKEVDGAMGVDPGRFAWAKGILGAVKRVQGKGGFG